MDILPDGKGHPEWFKNLREDGDFDNLALAARARREADWILGVNASIALGIAAGMGNHSLGRVQTPTLALVCRRYLENRDFMPVNFYHLRTGVCKDGQKVLFTRPLRYERKEDAEKARAGLEGESRCTVLAVEKKENMEEPPLPHDLTGLQQEANTRLGMAAGQTLAVVQGYTKEDTSHIREPDAATFRKIYSSRHPRSSPPLKDIPGSEGTQKGCSRKG